MSDNEYPNFAALAAACQVGVDYDVETAPRDHPIAIIAPHGGTIEPGTDIIARAIAGTDLGLHVFKALKPKPARTLHITSTHYDQPNALQLVANARIAVGIHGRRDLDNDAADVWMGGLNSNARAGVTQALNKAGFSATEKTGPLAGMTPANICNRAIEHGVQLEIPRSLRKSLTANVPQLQAFVKAVRTGLGL